MSHRPSGLEACRPSALNSCGKGDLVCWKHVSPYVSTLILDVGGYFFGPAGLSLHESRWQLNKGKIKSKLTSRERGDHSVLGPYLMLDCPGFWWPLGDVGEP